MVYTQEEIINALKIIKETCASINSCQKCPFYNGACYINRTQPEHWNIINEQPAIWRAFQ